MNAETAMVNRAVRIALVLWELSALLAISAAVVLLYLPEPLESVGWVCMIFGASTVVLRWLWWLLTRRATRRLPPFVWIRGRS